MFRKYFNFVKRGILNLISQLILLMYIIMMATNYYVNRAIANEVNYAQIGSSYYLRMISRVILITLWIAFIAALIYKCTQSQQKVPQFKIDFSRITKSFVYFTEVLIALIVFAPVVMIVLHYNTNLHLIYVLDAIASHGLYLHPLIASIFLTVLDKGYINIPVKVVEKTVQTNIQQKEQSNDSKEPIKNVEKNVSPNSVKHLKEQTEHNDQPEKPKSISANMAKLMESSNKDLLK